MSDAYSTKLGRDERFEAVLASSNTDANFAECDVNTGRVLRSFTDKVCGKRKEKEPPSEPAMDVDSMNFGSVSYPIPVDDF